MNTGYTVPKRNTAFLSRLAMCLALVILSSTWVAGTENGASVYPIGVETVFPGLTPPPGMTMFEEFNTTYQASQLVGANGQSLVPGFKLQVYAFAPKVIHNWGWRVLGGSLVSAFGIPLVNERLAVPGFSGAKTGFGNPELGVAYIAYNHRALHWWYGLDVTTPALGYQKNAAINIGQHNYATVPVGAFTYLPRQGRIELSSRFQYIVNFTDPVTHYRSGAEFTWEYAGMLSVTKKLAVGANGYFYQQATDDRQNNAIFATGNRGRDFAVGPQVRYQLGRFALIAKYQRDTLVQNRPCGNAVWVELGVPLGHPHATRASAAPEGASPAGSL
jgi:hypothetical protein